MINLKSEMQENEIILVITPNKEYIKTTLDISKQLNYLSEGVIYVSLNKMFDTLIDNFKKNKINPNKFFFIDVITKSVQINVEEKNNCIYLDGPTALTMLSLSIDGALKTKKFRVLFFDSLSTLLVHNNAKTVIKFVQDLINKSKRNGSKAVFTVLEGDMEKGVLKDLSMFVDNVVEINPRASAQSLKKEGLIKQ